MGEGLFNRAKAFIGLDEEQMDDHDLGGQQLDMSSILKGKKDKETKGGNGAYEIMMYEPKVYEDSLNISTHLRSGSPVIINLKHLDPAEGTRLIDFVCGTAYAIDGHMMKIGDTIFLFAPKTIAINSAEEKGSFGDELGLGTEKRDSFFSR